MEANNIHTITTSPKSNAGYIKAALILKAEQSASRLAQCFISRKFLEVK